MILTKIESLVFIALLSVVLQNVFFLSQNYIQKWNTKQNGSLRNDIMALCRMTQRQMTLNRMKSPDLFGIQL